MSGPDPRTAYPLPEHPRVGFLGALVDAPNVTIGSYTYYDDPDGPEHFYERCVLYHFPFVGDRLVIGSFCAIATGVRFIMAGANHMTGGLSTYPFEIFADAWGDPATLPPVVYDRLRDTVVGNDVWIGYRATVLTGVEIGDGAIIGAHAVVAADVPPYAVAVGNPARVVRQRFAPDVIERLQAIEWWDWPADRIAAAIPAIRSGDLDRLAALAPEPPR